VTGHCPSCQGEAGASPHPELRFACDVCGAPRVPRADRSLQYSGREAPLLRRADAARKARAGWRAAAVAGGLLLPFTLLILAALLLIFGASAGLLLAALVVIGPIAAFLAFALSRASARGREIGPALDAAWLAVATDVARQTPGLTADVLAAKLGIDVAQAEELTALLDVEAAAPSGAGRAPSRLRVGDADAAAAQPGLEMVEEEAALAERIEARARERLGPGAGKP
jgi:hypothetical protein